MRSCLGTSDLARHIVGTVLDSEVENHGHIHGSKLGRTARSQLAPRYFFLGANIDN